MADKTTTLKTKTGDNVYPNVLDKNIPDTITRVYILSYDAVSEDNPPIPLIKPVPLNTHAIYYIKVRLPNGTYFDYPLYFTIVFDEHDPSEFFLSGIHPSMNMSEGYLSEFKLSVSYGLVVNNNMITALIPIDTGGEKVFTPSKLVTLNGIKLYRDDTPYIYTLYSYTHTIRIKSATESLDIVVTAETDNETAITTFPALCQVLSGSTLDCHGHITSASKQPILIEIKSDSFKVYYLNNQDDTGSEEQIDFTTSETPEITDKVRPHKVYLKGQY